MLLEQSVTFLHVLIKTSYFKETNTEPVTKIPNMLQR